MDSIQFTYYLEFFVFIFVKTTKMYQIKKVFFYYESISVERKYYLFKTD